MPTEIGSRLPGEALARRKGPDGWRWIPERLIPAQDRSDGRLLQYGYRHYRELFNPRQLLHLSVLAEAIAAMTGPARKALALAFSDHLTTNCMLTQYAFGWRRLAPLFSIRAYRHVSRPVEINPWLRRDRTRDVSECGSASPAGHRVRAGP